MLASKPVKLGILTLITISLLFGVFLTAAAQDSSQSISSIKEKASHVWQSVKGGISALMTGSFKNMLKEEFKKEIEEMKQDISDLWGKINGKTKNER